MSTPAQIVRTYFERLLNEHDLSVCYELLAPTYIDHDAPPDTEPGPAATAEFVAAFLEEYPDLQIFIEQLIAENNTVAIRLAWLGTSRSGNDFLRRGILMLRVDNNNQIAERWSAYM